MLTLLLGGGAAIAGCCVFGPHACAIGVSRTLRLMLADATLRKDVAKFWGKIAEDAAVAIITGSDFRKSLSSTVHGVVEEHQLQATIRKGVIDALRDEDLQSEIKRMVLQGIEDADMHAAVQKAGISTIKLGVREAMEDSELKKIVSMAIADAMSDANLKAVLEDVIQETLRNNNIHEAFFQGAMTNLPTALNSLNPFRASPGATPPRASSPAPPQDASSSRRSSGAGLRVPTL
eukprot:TRINITY_DN95762_c0_g1_i1.p1 TRINITY_DN95762_c0_g1~~TRINITY_DN95762_c0_g1_i1.p1  ORF type:complete len:255 (+),score=57.52 TRINITY_DN95762_c0_g1_i1:65-766(+)